jgi:hypothetical protein
MNVLAQIAQLGTVVGLKPDLQAEDLLCRSGFSPTPSRATGEVLTKQTSSLYP